MQEAAENTAGDIYRAQALHDGTHLHAGAALWVQGGQIASVVAPGAPLPAQAVVHDLGAGVIAPGMVDLQVNGGGGVMLGAGADKAQIAQICAAHASLGATTILPTLITDRPAVSQAVIAAGIAAQGAGVPGFAGLHLEGPHLDPKRAGAHDRALIRPMDADDLALYLRAAEALSALMITLAPEGATTDQIAALSRAGVVVSLGHSDCGFEAAKAAFAAGAGCVTHLFNAMSALGHRAPGLVGAALDSPVAVGVIADGLHVADAPLRLALAAKSADRLFVVSDAMAVAGSDLDSFTLGGRQIVRRTGRLAGGRLELADGTLAGADISLPQSVAHLVRIGCPAERALAMATSVPADVIGAPVGRLVSGRAADFVHLDAGFVLAGVWQSGVRLQP